MRPSRHGRLVHDTDDGSWTHEVTEVTKPGGTAMNFVAPGAQAPGAFWFMQGR